MSLTVSVLQWMTVIVTFSFIAFSYYISLSTQLTKIISIQFFLGQIQTQLTVYQTHLHLKIIQSKLCSKSLKVNVTNSQSNHILSDAEIECVQNPGVCKYGELHKKPSLYTSKQSFKSCEGNYFSLNKNQLFIKLNASKSKKRFENSTNHVYGH